VTASEEPSVDETHVAEQIEVVPDDDLDWCSFVKKDKKKSKKNKKKGKNICIDVVYKTPAPHPVFNPVNETKGAEDDWGTWAAPKKDKKGKDKESIIEAIKSVSGIVEDPMLDDSPSTSSLLPLSSPFKPWGSLRLKALIPPKSI
jgi:hypothetical protein